MSVRQRSQHFEDLTSGAAAVYVDAKHFTKHGDADLKTDANEKTQKNRPRQEIRKEAEFEQSSEEEEDTGQQGHQACEGDISGAADWSQAGQAAREYGRSSGISGHHKIARRTEDGERNEGKQKGVEASDDRSAGNLGVAERLRDVHGRKRNSGQEILWYLGPSKRLKPLEERKAIRETRFGNSAVRHERDFL